MQCDRCADDAVIFRAYAGTHLCESHLKRSIEKRVRRRIRTDGLLPSTATPNEPVTWAVGLSGGKDSVVLTHLLDRTFREDPRVELVAVTIHEGIEGYRDASVAATEELLAERPIRHERRSYAQEFDVRMDAVAGDPEADLAPCAYCGVFRRDVLERVASEVKADLLLTGHNLDDEAQTAMMNLLSGDLDQMAKHFEASLGPLSERRTQDHFVPRAKPLRDIPEREVALYARLADLPAHMTECPHAEEAFRGTIQSLLYELEDGHPGTRHSIMAGYEELAGMVAADRGEDREARGSECVECGAPTRGDRCRRCQFLRQFGGRMTS